MTNLKSKIAVFSMAAAMAMTASAGDTISYEAELMLNASSGQLAPYYIASNRHGVITQRYSSLARLGAMKATDLSRRFSYGYGAEVLTGYTDKAPYSKYSSETGQWSVKENSPAPIWIQQLYGEVKYRSLFLNVGMKQRESSIVDFELSSGDVIQSGNSRPVPQVRAGFVDFQNIPFTKGGLQIMGEIAYGKFVQNDYLRDHFNGYSGHYNIGTLYHYKRLYFRTNPDRPFSATFGAQFVCLFGGTSYDYYNGDVSRVVKNRTNLKAFWQALVPMNNGIEGYFEGQHLGSWDIALRYRLPDGTNLRAYLMNLWEDGSGMGKLNGMDGLWGLEYKAPERGWIDGVVVEYIQFTNQGGPIHWDPSDNPGTTLTGVQATGSDNYYNNTFYNSYANFGMSMGTPFIKSPIYNLNGDLQFIDNRVKGFHIGINGTPFPRWSYRLLGSYRKSWGLAYVPRINPVRDVSLMAEVKWTPESVKGLSLKGQLAVDRGCLYGNNFGACLTATYSGDFNFKK